MRIMNQRDRKRECVCAGKGGNLPPQPNPLRILGLLSPDIGQPGTARELRDSKAGSTASEDFRAFSVSVKLVCGDLEAETLESTAPLRFPVASRITSSPYFSFI